MENTALRGMTSKVGNNRITYYVHVAIPGVLWDFINDGLFDWYPTVRFDTCLNCPRG